jgi:hypothetical protein
MASPFEVTQQPVGALQPGDWDELWGFAERFTDTTREVFEASVREKKVFVFIRERATRRLVGIGGIDLYAVEWQGERRWVIYAGNTVFEEGVRGFSIVQQVGFQTYLKARLRHPLEQVFLFFDTYSFKSYLMLPRNFAEYWPRHDQATPPHVLAFQDHLGRLRYGDRWDAARGLCTRGNRKLKPWVARITEDERQDPHIAYYAARNPGYAEGDMLAVLVPLHARNWVQALRSVARRARRRPAARAR